MITGFTPGTDTVTFAPATTQAVGTQTYEIWPKGRADIGQIAGADISTSTAQLGVNAVQAGGTAWGSGAITAGAIATDAITAAKVADGTIDAATFAAGAINATAIAADAIGASELAADAVAEIADAVWDEDATGHQTQGTFGQAIGDPAADTDTIWGLANTNLNATVSSRASQTSVDTVDDFLDTEIAAIKAKTDLIPGTIDGKTFSELVTLIAAVSQTSVDTVDDFLDTEIGQD